MKYSAHNQPELALRLEDIWNSYQNGQFKQMAEQIDDYGLYDVFADLYDYILDIYGCNVVNSRFNRIVIMYHRVKYQDDGIS